MNDEDRREGHDSQHDDDHASGEHDGSSERHETEHGESGGPIGGLAGGTAEVLEGVAGLVSEEDEDAKRGLETAATVAKTVQDGAEAGQQFARGIEAAQQGEVGEAASGVGGALGAAGGGVTRLAGGVADVLPAGEAQRGFRDAQRTASAVGAIARGVAEVVEGGAELFEGLGGHERHEVHYALEIDGSPADLHVTTVFLSEAIGALGSCSVSARAEGHGHWVEAELLGKDAGLLIERGEARRSFRGVVQRARVSRRAEHEEVRLEILPAFWLADQTQDSRIYQDISVPDLVERVVRELIGDRKRTVRSELTAKYAAHEYLVQHRESHWTFLKRMCDEEGIFLYFDFDEKQFEVLVLADSNDDRPQARPNHDGEIPYEESENQRDGREVAWNVERHHRVGPTDAVVAGFDWTNPGLAVRHERVERAAWGGTRLEVYDHDHAVRHHGYNDGGGSYQAHTAERASRFHTERLDALRDQWSISTTVLGAMPGHVFELTGSDGHDGRYLVLDATTSGDQNDHGGELENRLSCIRAETPYRPPAPQRRLMHGPETATVVGPPGEEIHTDRHGRIKVQFHWDRRGQNDEHSSVWIRVNYGWAGPGWGQIFIPRIGMEVIVAFLGGDPDRPIVMGCLYNGANPPPYPLPDDKTKSTIKTNSSVGGGGYNELRFEDKKGQEEVFIHAEKDFNEVVENNHTTRVKNCQTNNVDVDQTETVKRDQTMTVENNREKTVINRETNRVKGTRHTTIGEEGGNDILRVVYDRMEQIEGAEDRLDVTTGSKFTTVAAGRWDIATTGRFQVKQNETTHFELKEHAYLNTPGQVQIKAGDGAVHYRALPEGMLVVRTSQNEVHDVGADFNVEAGATMRLRAGINVAIEADTEIQLKVGPSAIKLTASGIEISGPSITVSATAGDATVTAAGVVKLKP